MATRQREDWGNWSDWRQREDWGFNYSPNDDQIKGFRWQQPQAQTGFSLGGPAASASATNKTPARVNKITKPGFEGFFDRYKAQVDADASANRKDLGTFTTAQGKATQSNAGDLGQETGAIGDVFKGKIGTGLKEARETFSTKAGDLVASTRNMLDSIRNSQSSQISKLGSDLGAQRQQFGTQLNTELAQEKADRNAWLNEYINSARRGTNNAIGDSMAEAKSQSLYSGGAGSSLLRDRAGAIRSRAETALAENVAAQKKDILDRIRAQQAGNTQQLGSMERGEIGDIAGMNLRLGDTARSDETYLSGMGRDTNAQLFNAERQDVLAEQDAKNRLLGARRNLRNAVASDYLTPIQARSAMTQDELRNAAALAGLDDATAFYLLDSGGAYNPQWWTPRSSFRNLPMPGYPNVPYSDYSPPDWSGSYNGNGAGNQSGSQNGQAWNYFNSINRMAGRTDPEAVAARVAYNDWLSKSNRGFRSTSPVLDYPGQYRNYDLPDAAPGSMGGTTPANYYDDLPDAPGGSIGGVSVPPQNRVASTADNDAFLANLNRKWSPSQAAQPYFPLETGSISEAELFGGMRNNGGGRPRVFPFGVSPSGEGYEYNWE